MFLWPLTCHACKLQLLERVLVASINIATSGVDGAMVVLVNVSIQRRMVQQTLHG